MADFIDRIRLQVTRLPGDSVPPRLRAALQCGLDSADWLPAARLVVLRVPAHENTSMNGAIAVARSINPSVVLVFTVSGDAPDTAYVRRGDNWIATTTEGVMTDAIHQCTVELISKLEDAGLIVELGDGQGVVVVITDDRAFELLPVVNRNAGEIRDALLRAQQQAREAVERARN